MSRASLMTRKDRTFAFEHAMSHRNALGVIWPLPRFSVIPYFIEPEVKERGKKPSSSWHLDHQQAHNDALANFPSQYGSTQVGLHIGVDLRDYDLDRERTRKWWEFQNHMEHYVASNSILPTTPAPYPTRQWRYPFW